MLNVHAHNREQLSSVGLLLCTKLCRAIITSFHLSNVARKTFKLIVMFLVEVCSLFLFPIAPYPLTLSQDMIQDQLVAEGAGSESEGIPTYQVANRKPLFTLPGHPGIAGWRGTEEEGDWYISNGWCCWVSVVTYPSEFNIFFPVLIQYLVNDLLNTMFGRHCFNIGVWCDWINVRLDLMIKECRAGLWCYMLPGVQAGVFWSRSFRV